MLTRSVVPQEDLLRQLLTDSKAYGSLLGSGGVGDPGRNAQDHVFTKVATSEVSWQYQWLVASGALVADPESDEVVESFWACILQLYTFSMSAKQCPSLDLQLAGSCSRVLVCRALRGCARFIRLVSRNT